MANARDLDFTYSLIDRIFRLSLGELADFSGAKYDGDFSLTLEGAQRRKHEYIGAQIGIGPGRRVLDLGCGWGPLLAFIRERGGSGVGVTLSSAQAKACRRHGLDVHLRDARQVTTADFGSFDAVASLGAFEHFCSVEEHAAGRQEEIYRGLFDHIADLLPAGERLYLQTMVYGRNMIPLEDSSGRLDYLETIAQWRGRFGEPSFRKTLMKARLVPRYLTSSDFRLAFTSGVSANSVCFERELMDHYRLVFEKQG